MVPDGFQINHVGIIMDGNGRWANDQGLPRAQGHFQGAKVVKDIVKAAPGLGIKVLTIYAFSTENWNRPKYEIKTLMSLFQSQITKQFEDLLENNVRIRFIGSKNELPPERKQKGFPGFQNSGESLSPHEVRFLHRENGK